MCTRCAFLTGLAGAIAMPAIAAAETGDPQTLEIAQPGMQRISSTMASRASELGTLRYPP